MTDEFKKELNTVTAIYEKANRNPYMADGFQDGARWAHKWLHENIDTLYEIKILRQKLAIAVECLEEISKRPYKDSNIESLYFYSLGYVEETLKKLKTKAGE